MELKELQNKIKRFDKERGWNKDWNLKDLSLNLTEEIGELWNLVKWVDVEKQKEIVKKKKEEVSDFVGDALFLILKIANQTDIDAEKQKEIVKKKKEEVSDFVGDALFLILKIANQTDIDAEKEYFQH